MPREIKMNVENMSKRIKNKQVHNQFLFIFTIEVGKRTK